MPQPNLGPFTSSTSRNTHNRGISGSTSTLCFLPLTVSSIILKSPWVPCVVLAFELGPSLLLRDCGEAQALVLERQRADAPAGGREDRIAQRGGEGRERRLAHAAPEAAARDEDRLDGPRHLGDAHDAVVVEIRLLDAAVEAVLVPS